MQRVVYLSTIAYGLLLAGLITLRGELVALSIPFVAYLLYGLWIMPEPPRLQIERKLSDDRAAPGSDVVVSLTIRNLGRTIEELSIQDGLVSHLFIRLGSPRHLLRLPGGTSKTVTYTITGPRGAYAFDRIGVVVTDSLGLISYNKTMSVPGQLFVFPDVRRMKSVSIRPRKTRVYAGMIPARAGGPGTEFFGVREYLPGDAPRSINWRAGARHPEHMFSNEFQQERVADVGIVLDARERANIFHGGVSIFEHSVLAAAALSNAFIMQGNRVGLLVYGSYLGWTQPGYGKVQRELIMRSLAGAMVGDSTVFAGLNHLSERMFPSESQIVLVSSLVNDDMDILIQLRARGYQVLVVSPDPVRFERDLLPPSDEVEQASRIVRLERDLLIRRLERAAVRVIEWDLSKPFDQAVGPVLMRPHPSVPRRAP